MLALLSAGNELWPAGCYRRIAALALIAGRCRLHDVRRMAERCCSRALGLFRVATNRIGIWIEERYFTTAAVDYGALSRLCSNECCNSQVQQRRTVAPLLILISRSVRTQRQLDARVQRVRNYLIIPSLRRPLSLHRV